MFIKLNQDYSAINLFKKETVMTGSIYHSADSLKIFGRICLYFFFIFIDHRKSKADDKEYGDILKNGNTIWTVMCPGS